MFPDLFGGESDVDVEVAKFCVFGGDFIEAHFVDDFFDGVHLMG